MSMDSAEDIKKHIRVYMTVGCALLFLTAVTVGVSYIHLPIALAIFVGLLIATVKASLVAGYFMHLIDEKKIIYWVLAITAIFFVALMMLPIFTDTEVHNYLQGFSN